jgi:hypothetical protein
MNTVASNITGTVVGTAKRYAKQALNRYKQGINAGIETAKDQSLKNLARAESGEAGIGEVLKENLRINRDYMNTGGLTDKAIKYGTVVGGYVGLNVGARWVRGGDVGRDPNGRPDIAGVPFI